MTKAEEPIVDERHMRGVHRQQHADAGQHGRDRQRTLRREPEPTRSPAARKQPAAVHRRHRHRVGERAEVGHVRFGRSPIECHGHSAQAIQRERPQRLRKERVGEGLELGGFALRFQTEDRSNAE